MNDTAQSVGTKPAFLYDAIHPRWSPAHWQQHVADQKEWGEEAPDLRSAGKVKPWAGDFMEPGTVQVSYTEKLELHQTPEYYNFPKGICCSKKGRNSMLEKCYDKP